MGNKSWWWNGSCTGGFQPGGGEGKGTHARASASALQRISRGDSQPVDAPQAAGPHLQARAPGAQLGAAAQRVVRLKLQAEAGQLSRRQPPEQLQAAVQGRVGLCQVCLRLGGLAQQGPPGGARHRQAGQRAALPGRGQGQRGAQGGCAAVSSIWGMQRRAGRRADQRMRTGTQAGQRGRRPASGQARSRSRPAQTCAGGRPHAPPRRAEHPRAAPPQSWRRRCATQTGLHRRCMMGEVGTGSSVLMSTASGTPSPCRCSSSDPARRVTAACMTHMHPASTQSIGEGLRLFKAS